MTNSVRSIGTIPAPGIDFVVTCEELVSSNVDAVLEKENPYDCLQIDKYIRVHRNSLPAEEQGPFLLLEFITSCFFDDTSNGVTPFRPTFVTQDSQAIIPTDLLHEQICELAKFAKEIRSPALRARVADVVWYCCRHCKTYAGLAVSSYSDCARYSARQEPRSTVREVRYPISLIKHCLGRATQISRQTNWERTVSEHIVPFVIELASIAFCRRKVDFFINLARIALEHGDMAKGILAAWAEVLARDASLALDSDTRIILWDIAKDCCSPSDDPAETTRYEIMMAKCLVEKANSSGSAMQVTYFLSEALDRIQNFKIEEARVLRADVLRQARAAQREIPNEIGVFSAQVPIPQQAKDYVDNIKGKSFPMAIRALVLCDEIPEVDDLRARSEKLDRRNSLTGLFSELRLDHQCLIKSKWPKPKPKEDAKPPLFSPETLQAMSKYRSMHRAVVVQSLIDPIREAIVHEHPISVDMVYELLRDCWFMPGDRKYIFAEGIERFLHGDNLAAASLLVLQVENSLKHILHSTGIETIQKWPDSTQTEASLSSLLDPDNDSWHPHLAKIIPASVLLELELLLNYEEGPGVRNSIAHGKCSMGEYWAWDVTYACWLMMYLAMRPLMENWDEVDRRFSQRTAGAGWIRVSTSKG